MSQAPRFAPTHARTHAHVLLSTFAPAYGMARLAGPRRTVYHVTGRKRWATGAELWGGGWNGGGSSPAPSCGLRLPPPNFPHRGLPVCANALGLILAMRSGWSVCGVQIIGGKGLGTRCLG